MAGIEPLPYWTKDDDTTNVPRDLVEKALSVGVVYISYTYVSSTSTLVVHWPCKHLCVSCIYYNVLTLNRKLLPIIISSICSRHIDFYFRSLQPLSLPMDLDFVMSVRTLLILFKILSVPISWTLTVSNHWPHFSKSEFLPLADCLRWQLIKKYYLPIYLY